MTRALALILFPVLGILLPTTAQAFPWMIKHGYVGCQVCHVDPSGAGILTKYGRAQSELLLKSRYGPPSDDGSVSKSTQFLLGAFQLPDAIEGQVAVRGGVMLNRTAIPGSRATDQVIPLQMVTDARVAVIHDWLRASASVGIAIRRGQAAALFPRKAEDGFKLVSREFWAGASLMDDQMLVRVGRINLPFGIRGPEHNAWVRTSTRTDINEDQQYGVAVAYTGEGLRAEVMGIAGNFQISPADYHQRGAAGFVELAFAPQVAGGLSFLATFAGADNELRTHNPVRQAYGVFGRWGVTSDLALQAEANVLHYGADDREGAFGASALAQADLEVVRGLHLIATGELLRDPSPEQHAFQRGAWLGLSWFAFQGVEFRVDGIVRQIPRGEGLADISNLIVLSQVNLFF